MNHYWIKTLENAAKFQFISIHFAYLFFHSDLSTLDDLRIGEDDLNETIEFIIRFYKELNKLRRKIRGKKLIFLNKEKS